MPLSSPPPTSSSSSISSSSRIRKYNNNYKQQNWIIITILFIVLLLCNNFVSSNTIRYDDLNSPYARGSPYGSLIQMQILLIQVHTQVFIIQWVISMVLKVLHHQLYN